MPPHWGVGALPETFDLAGPLARVAPGTAWRAEDPDLRPVHWLSDGLRTADALPALGRDLRAGSYRGERVEPADTLLGGGT